MFQYILILPDRVAFVCLAFLWQSLFWVILLKFVENIHFQATDQEYEREKLNERIAKLSGGVAVIQVTLMLNFS